MWYLTRLSSMSCTMAAALRGVTPSSAATARMRSAEDVVAAAPHDDAFALAYHVGEDVERAAVQRTLVVAQGRDCELKLVHGPLLKEVVHFGQHAFGPGHLQKALAGVEGYVVAGGKLFADVQCAASALPCYCYYHCLMFFENAAKIIQKSEILSKSRKYD